MKNIFLITALCCAMMANAQVTQVSVQASGLTCSMCSNAINKSLQTLAFVQKVEANIATSTFDISFKPGAAIDFDQIKKKVEAAGFFVAKFNTTIHFNNVALANDGHLTTAGMVFHFLNVKDQTLNGDKTIQLLDKGYVTAKAYKTNSKYTMMDCYKTGVAGACCAKEGLKAGTRIFHATI